jgi:hypothetical protein
VRTNRHAQIGRGDGGGGDDEELTRHGFSLSGSSTDEGLAVVVADWLDEQTAI